MSDCVICLNEIYYFYKKPYYCDCKITMHTSCYNQLINKLNIYCPICRSQKRYNGEISRALNMIPYICGVSIPICGIGFYYMIRYSLSYLRY